MSSVKSNQEVFHEILNAYKNDFSIKQVEKKFNGQNPF